MRSRRVKAKGIQIIIYESSLLDNVFYGYEVIKDLNEFKLRSDLIVT